MQQTRRNCHTFAEKVSQLVSWQINSLLRHVQLFSNPRRTGSILFLQIYIKLVVALNSLKRNYEPQSQLCFYLHWDAPVEQASYLFGRAGFSACSTKNRDYTRVPFK